MQTRIRFSHSCCARDQHNFILVLGIAILSFSSAFMAADASFLTIPALGRSAELGFLYDERTDKFRPISVFSKAIPTEVVLQTQNTDVATHTQVTNTYDEKLELLEIGFNAAANILVENTKVRGTARILKETNENYFVEQQTLLRTQHTVDENLQVFYNDLRPFFTEFLLQHREATHIVSGISWGSRISVTLQTTATPGVDADEWSDAFYHEFQIIKGRSSISNQMNENFNFTIDIKSDIPLTRPLPTTTSDAAILLNEMPQIINDTEDGKGVPLEFTLTPLSEIRSHLDVQTIINNPVQKIAKSTLRSLSIIFDDIASSQKRINALYQKTYLQLNCLPPQSRQEIADLRTIFLNYKNTVADNLKEMLVDVRSGSKPTSTLTDYAEKFKRSNFSSRNIKTKIREYDDVTEKLTLCQILEASYSNIEYFNSNQNLIPRISENSDRPIYILFTKTEFKNNNPVKYTDDLNTFLKTLYVPSNKLFIVDCDGGSVSCSSLTQTKIHEYKNGKLTSTDFSQDTKEEESDLRKEFNDLRNDIRILHNVTAQLRRELQNHIENQPADYCESRPCENGGVCRSGENSFSCTCPSAFTGSTCSENVNECESAQNPCENGGRCINEIGGFTCVCPLSFAGRKCHEKLDPCKNNQCQNDASCIASFDFLDFVCSCADGFNGTFCELDIDDCLLSEGCQNGGTCVDGINTYTCACAEGYQGRDCATLTNNCAVNDPCTNGGTCVNGMNSIRCICSDRFAGNYCQHVKMCQYPGTCAPQSDAGSCGRCRDGFVKDPEDATRCKYANGNASLIISSQVDIRMSSINGLNTTQLIKNKDHVLGTDYDFRTNAIFWFSYSDRKIYTAQINEEAGKKSILHDSSSLIYGVGVDWIHEHLYWVDDGRDQIAVSNLNGTMKKILFSDGLSHPYSIAVNPLSGWMYWSDKGTYRIERAGLDGSRREVVLSTNIRYPHSLVANLEDNRLYWSQGWNPSSIWSCEFDGSDRKLIFTAKSSQFSSSHFWKIATYDTFVYFIEGYSKTVYKVNKCNGEELTLIYKSESYLRDIKIYDANQQPKGDNLCSKRIGSCSHFCFPFPSSGNGSVPMTTTTCACPDGLSLSADQQNCV